MSIYGRILRVNLRATSYSYKPKTILLNEIHQPSGHGNNNTVNKFNE